MSQTPEPTAVTAEEVRAAALASGKHWIDHHRCAGCDSMVGYYVDGGELYFDAACGCSGSGSAPRQRTWQSAADWINMQTNPDVRAELMARFGLTRTG